MSRYVWLVEQRGLTEAIEVYGTLRRAVAALAGTDVYDESRRGAPVTEVDMSPDRDDPVIEDDPLKPLTRTEIRRELSVNNGRWASWHTDGAGDTTVSITRMSVL